MKKHAIDIIIILCLFGLSFFLYGYGRIISTDYFGYDESDYMYAVSKGLYANYTDKGAIPFLTYMELGLTKGLRKEEWTSLSEFIRSCDDITSYRHSHGPLYFYALALSERLFGKGEALSRRASLAFLSLSVMVSYIGCLLLADKNERIAAILASGFLLFSPTNILTSAIITPHGLYVLTAIVALLLIAGLLKTKKSVYLYYAVVATAFAFLTIEYAILLMITLIVCVWIQAKQIFPDWPRRKILVNGIVIPTGLFFGTIFIMWPGGLVKLSLIKSYIGFSYFALVRGSAYGTDPFWVVWLNRFCHSPVEYMLIIATTIIAILRLKRYRYYLPFVIYALLLFVTTFRNTSTSPTYISSLLPTLYILSGMMIADLLSKLVRIKRVFVTTVILFSLFISCYWNLILPKSKNIPQHTLRDVVTYFHNNSSCIGNVLLDRNFVPTLHYYLPDKRFSSYWKKDETVCSILDKLRKEPYDGIIFCAGGDRLSFERCLGKHFALDATSISNYWDVDIIHYKIKPLKQ